MKDTLPSLKKRNKIHHLQAAFVAVYPIIKASLEMWVLALQLGYLISKTETHHPWILLSGVRLESLSTADLSRMYPQRDWTPPVDAGYLYKEKYLREILAICKNSQRISSFEFLVEMEKFQNFVSKIFKNQKSIIKNGLFEK